MAYTDDKIIRGGEITQQGVFEQNSFYVMLVPKSTESASVAVLNAKLAYNEELMDFPFAVGVWNPTVISKLNVKSTDLTSYRIFWGSESV